MPSKDLHSEPFGSETIAKLEIFEDYAEAWIPTFVMQGKRKIGIFDFFAGTGYDKVGVPGSPIRTLDKLKQQIGNIIQKRVKVILYLNEYEPNKSKQHKFALLKESCNEYLNKFKELRQAVEVKFYNEDFSEVFPKLLNCIKLYPSLVYLDQNGIKFLSEKYFLELEKCNQTDFLYFVSSSYFWRFGKHEAFSTHFDIDIEEAKKDPYKFIHKNILKELRNRLSKDTRLKLYPYSLKKGTNIHGIIFGASHPLAVDKFLKIAWKRNDINGEANFDIYGDTPNPQLSLFGEKLNKVQLFQKGVKEKVMNREIKNNAELFDFAQENGHIGIHAADCLKSGRNCPKGASKYRVK